MARLDVIGNKFCMGAAWLGALYIAYWHYL